MTFVDYLLLVKFVSSLWQYCVLSNLYLFTLIALKCKRRNYFHLLQYRYITPSKFTYSFKIYIHLSWVIRTEKCLKISLLYMYKVIVQLSNEESNWGVCKIFHLTVLLPYIPNRVSSYCGGIDIIMLYWDVLPYASYGRFIEICLFDV